MPFSPTQVALAEWATEWAPKLEEAARREAPKDTGQGAEDLLARARGRLEFTRIELVTHLMYMVYQREGTGLYGPKGSKYPIPKGGAPEQLAKGYPLHWINSNGEHVYAWTVMHPGVRPNDFPERAWESIKEEALRDMELRIARAALKQFKETALKQGAKVL